MHVLEPLHHVKSEHKMHRQQRKLERERKRAEQAERVEERVKEVAAQAERVEDHVKEVAAQMQAMQQDMAELKWLLTRRPQHLPLRQLTQPGQPAVQQDGGAGSEDETTELVSPCGSAASGEAAAAPVGLARRNPTSSPVQVSERPGPLVPLDVRTRI